MGIGSEHAYLTLVPGGALLVLDHDGLALVCAFDAGEHVAFPVTVTFSPPAPEPPRVCVPGMPGTVDALDPG